ncbi:hypothetical protein L1D31_21185 [Vibrio sp. Isolate23]|uniref:hypothetical protein n=1 Tax=Vibrio sp. Isolate23 TaxID=2908533 RepID=UPI001EFEA2E5|nr:hypothetical protein [Vibrio sp. Isolate23]MCG9685039.1 hypothetical protein [Vibrio sp. Isolate23]
MKLLALSLSLLLLSGCSTTTKDGLSFIENVEYEHVIGVPSTNKRNVIFTYSREGKKDRTVALNIDFEPVVMRFKLCENNGQYDGLSDADISVVSKLTVNCDSWVAIHPLENDKYLLSYELNLLLGFQPKYIDGKKVLEPIMKKLAQYKAVYRPESVAYPLKRYSNDKLVESTFVDFNL